MSRDSRSMPLMLRRLLTLSALTAAIVSTAAGPAIADPAGPTNYESTIVEIRPEPTVATFEIVGGDAFLQVTVEPGHEVAIPGYGGEEYIRIDADGTVWINDDSQARYINEDRYGDVDIPEDVDNAGAPRWVKVGSDGEYAWHDHRVHWMSRYRPPAVQGDTRQVVFPWSLTVLVDGVETSIEGELTWVPSVSPVVPAIVGAVVVVPLLLLLRRPLPGLAALVVIAAVIGGAVAIAQNNATPVAARGLPVWVVFPAVAALAAGWATTGRNLRSLTPLHLLMTAGVALAAWALSTVEVLTMPILPSALPAGAERAAVAFVLWTGAGIALAAALASIRAARS